MLEAQGPVGSCKCHGLSPFPFSFPSSDLPPRSPSSDTSSLFTCAFLHPPSSLPHHPSPHPSAFPAFFVDKRARNTSTEVSAQECARWLWASCLLAEPYTQQLDGCQDGAISVRPTPPRQRHNQPGRPVLPTLLPVALDGF